MRPFPCRDSILSRELRCQFGAQALCVGLAPLGAGRMISDQGEQRSQDIMQSLDLSQSAASRHLKQLSATGYLFERRFRGAKYYKLNSERIQNTLEAISTFLLSA